jgi:hypothetical protein
MPYPIGQAIGCLWGLGELGLSRETRTASSLLISRKIENAGVHRQASGLLPYPVLLHCPDLHDDQSLHPRVKRFHVPKKQEGALFRDPGSEPLTGASQAFYLSILIRNNTDNRGSATFIAIIEGARTFLSTKPCAATGAEVVSDG